uniref:DNA-directed DNA polymerase n=1 Tax=Cecropis daurica densovirus TaxID=2794495 RepID=A0A8A4XCW9_9VIRU|nr:MAG: PolB [Cecropis daurica densovirus]
MATFTVYTLDEAADICEEILQTYQSIRVSLVVLFEWFNPAATIEAEQILRTRFTIDAETLDKDEIATSQWEQKWAEIWRKLEDKKEYNTEQSGLSFLRIVEIKVNWLHFIERNTRGELADGVYGYSRRASTASSNGYVEVESLDDNSDGYPRINVSNPYRLTFVELLFICARISRGGSRQRSRAINRSELQSFVHANHLEHLIGAVANISNICELCSNLHNISVVVYNKRSNVIFRRIIETEDESEVTPLNAILYWNGIKMYAIKNLNRFLSLREREIPVCLICGRTHSVTETCDMPEVALGSLEKGFAREDEQVLLTMYADIEAICPPGERQFACCYSLVSTVGNSEISIIEKIADTSTNISSEQAEKNLIEHLLAKIEERIAYFHGWSGVEMQLYNLICHWCEQDKRCVRLRRVVITTGNYQQRDNVCMKCYKQPMIKRLYQCIVFFHNFSKYDICFIIRVLIEKYDITLAGKNTNLIYNIICRHKTNITTFRIRDSLHFISGSIASFAKYVPESRWTDLHLQDYFSLFQGNKGKMPYEWLQGRWMLDYPFPMDAPVDEQINQLNNTKISLRELAVFCEEVGIPTVGEYLQKYCTIDCLLLFFYFQSYREKMFEKFEIDIAQFFSTPSVSWYLGMRGAENINIPQSIDDYMDIKENIRGGVSQPIERYAEVGQDNIESMKMLDVNALYSWCMLQKLPEQHITTIDIDSNSAEVISMWQQNLLSRSEDEIWLCKVDLHYPEELHEMHVHFSFPLAPHHFNERLCTTFEDKLQYLIMDKHLIFCIEKGLKITKWHNVQRWKSGHVFRDFIQENIDARQATNDPTEKDARKRTNNSLFGKTCENVFNYKQFTIASLDQLDSEETNAVNPQARNWTDFTVIDDEHVIAQTKISSVILNKPIQLGFAILEYAKLRNYQFWYALCSIFGRDVHLCYMDTDSMLLAFEKYADPFAIMRENSSIFNDLIDLPVDENNEELPPTKLTGAFSNEVFPKNIVSYVGLKAKSYVIKFDDDSTKLRAKGIRPNALHENRSLTYDDFLNALFRSEEIRVEEATLSRQNYNVKLIVKHKKALTNLDVKHFYTDNLVIGYPWGFKIN